VVKVKLRNRVTRKRVSTIAILVFAEAFIGPLNATLQTGAWPTPVQIAGSLTSAVLQVVTVVAGLLEKA